MSNSNTEIQKAVGGLKGAVPTPIRRKLRRFYKKSMKLLKYNSITGLYFTLFYKNYRYQNCEFDIPAEMTSLSFRSHFLFNDYEAEEIALLKKYLKTDDKVLELGACIGIVSCITNKMLDTEKGSHVVVEANPNLIPYLEGNKQKNICTFEIAQCAIAEGDEITFYINDEIVKGSAQLATENKVTVSARSILSLEEQYGDFNVMLCDIQGGEIDVLRQSESILSHYRFILLELHSHILGPEKTQECKDILIRNGFELTEQQDIVGVWLNPSAQ